MQNANFIVIIIFYLIIKTLYNPLRINGLKKQELLLRI